jgi:hypothetical protein
MSARGESQPSEMLDAELTPVMASCAENYDDDGALGRDEHARLLCDRHQSLERDRADVQATTVFGSVSLMPRLALPPQC